MRLALCQSNSNATKTVIYSWNVWSAWLTSKTSSIKLESKKKPNSYEAFPNSWRHTYKLFFDIDWDLILSVVLSSMEAWEWDSTLWMRYLLINILSPKSTNYLKVHYHRFISKSNGRIYNSHQFVDNKFKRYSNSCMCGGWLVLWILIGICVTHCNMNDVTCYITLDKKQKNHEDLK